MKCIDVIQVLQRLSPPEYACSWDNVGLLVGHEEQEVHKIFVALDANMEVVEQAVRQGADLLVTHHPMIFHGIKQVTDQTPLGKKILLLAENHIAYFAMHTNFDIKGSMAELAAQALELKNTLPLEVTCQQEECPEGIGKIGDWKEETTVAHIVERVKKEFQLDTVMVYGDLQQSVRRVAISPGSGKSMITPALDQGAQVLITGDIGHHEGMDAVEAGLCVIDATHYGLEHIFTPFLASYLKEQGIAAEVEVCSTSSPCQFI